MKKLGVFSFLFIVFFPLITRPAFGQLPAVKDEVETAIGGSVIATTYTCPSQDYQSCLKTQFGANIKGSGATDEVLKLFYNSLAKGFNTLPGALPLFKSMTPTYTFSSCYTGKCDGLGDAWAVTYPNGDQTYYKAWFTGSSAYKQYVIIHESGHVVADAKKSLSEGLYNNTYNEGLDHRCFNSYGVLKTYPQNLLIQRFGTPTPMWSRISETWGDAYSNTILCKNNSVCPSHGGGGQSINDFPTTCSHIYNFVVSKVGP